MKGRVLVVDDHVLVAIGSQLALSARGWDVETSSGPTAADVVAHAERFQPHCVLLDINIGGGVGSGIDLIRPLLSTGGQVVMLTGERRRLILAECVEAGAAGWIRKNAEIDDVESTVGQVVEGGSLMGRADRAALLEDLRLDRAGRLRALATFDRLTKREALVLGELIDGRSAEEIAEIHFVALTTVRSQIRAILHKLGVRSQLAAVALAGGHRDLLPHEVQAGRDRRRGGYAVASRSRGPASIPAA
ncbi:MAG TPA: LuxR C-terminal-related transcriptional regulator [Ilumatobacteraceae bacterium]|nr:LuxR C-terminal-related transcriptional regulator [Ilumatobacteraceae bacterium]